MILDSIDGLRFRCRRINQSCKQNSFYSIARYFIRALFGPKLQFKKINK